MVATQYRPNIEEGDWVEKLIYPVWKSDLESNEEFRDKLLQELAPKLLECDPRRLKVCAVDEHVAEAAPYRMENTCPAMSGVLIIWVNTAVYRQAMEQLIAEHVAAYTGYLVTESEPLLSDSCGVAPGEKTPGMNQLVFLRRPPRLCVEEWLDVWLGSHTQVAIETQSTFGYRQNVIARSLTYAAPHYDAIIEENFPQAAISSRAAFYDADGNEELYRQREKEMVDSCVRFIDFDKIDCIPMSEYIFR
jgi:hypothetical protein